MIDGVGIKLRVIRSTVITGADAAEVATNLNAFFTEPPMGSSKDRVLVGVAFSGDGLSVLVLYTE